jgi:hypothetical protein
MTDVHVPAAAKPAIIGSAITAWRDAFAAINGMPILMAVAFALLLAANAAYALFIPQSDTGQAVGLSLGLQVLGFVLWLIESFLLAPVAIAVLRFVLLGEVTPSYALNPSDQRLLRFFGFLALFSTLWAALWAIMTWFFSQDWSAMAMAIGGMLILALLVVICIVLLRTVILLPAIAVDAPGAQWGNAFADSNGHSWRILFIMICSLAPFAVIYLLLHWLFLRPPGPTLWSGAAYVLTLTIIQLPMLAAFAAMASRLFAAFAGRLGHPPR